MAYEVADFVDHIVHNSLAYQSDTVRTAADLFRLMAVSNLDRNLL